MPTYEYRCRACGEHVEVVQSFRDDPLTTCGICGGDLRKVFSASGLIFKGSGYYVTDTRSASSESSGEGSGEGPSKSEKDKSSKGEGKDEGTSKGGSKGKDTASTSDSSSRKAESA